MKTQVSTAIILRCDILGRHFGLENHKNIKNAQFILSIYDIQNGVSHDRGTCKVLELHPTTPILMSYIKKYLRLLSLYVGKHVQQL